MSSFLVSTFTGISGAEILIAAAADLAPSEAALTRLAPAGAKFTFGSSGQIANQIRAGAPYDVYLSADIRLVRGLAAERKVDPATVTLYALGRVGLWSRSGKVRRLEDLRSPAVLQIAIANPDHAPYGVAARDILSRSGLWEAVKPRVVYGESVRQAMQFAASGNAEAALVAWSLVHDRGGVLIPSALHAPIEQAGAVVAWSKRAEEGRRFLNALAGEAGQSYLSGAGFDPVAAPVAQAGRDTEQTPARPRRKKKGK